MGAPAQMEIPTLSGQLPSDSSSDEVATSSVSRWTNIRTDEPPVQALLMASLPPPDTKRWVVRRKAAVVAAVRGGGISIEEACRYYQLSEEELLSWERAFETHGLAGLRATRIQQYRLSRPARPRPRR